MNPLPKWALLNPFPAIHDFESLTVLEQTARVYGAMNGLIKEYNAFAEVVNTQIASFTEDEQEAREAFETNITKIMRQLQCSIKQQISGALEEYEKTKPTPERMTVVRDGQTITITEHFADNTSSARVIELDASDYPVTINGIPVEWSGFNA